MAVQNKNANPKLDTLGMVGSCFIFWGKTTWQYQGIIRGEPSPGQYLCQFFECLMGERPKSRDD